MIWIALILATLAIISFLINKKDKQDLKRRSEYKPAYRYEYDTLCLFDSDMENKFFGFYKNELEENEEYNYTAKELKEDYMDEKVYKYAPYDLPYNTRCVPVRSHDR